MDYINKIEIELVDDESFLKIRETLTRIGVANNRTKTLYQSCHILQSRGRYYIVHFKELLAMDGRAVEISNDDVHRRNHIAKLLQEWNLCKILHEDEHEFVDDVPCRIISYRDSKDWNLRYKYKIGN